MIGLPVVAIAAAVLAALLVRLALLLTGHRRSSSNALYLAALVECSEDAIIATDLDGVVTNWNPAAERIFGYSRSEAVGRPIWALISPGHERESLSMLRRIALGRPIDPVERFETQRTRKDGTTLDVSLTLSPVRNRSGDIVGVSGILRDVTEQRRLEKRLRAAERMEAVGQLAGGIAHDFNNMLTAVLGHSELLAASLEEHDERRKHAEQIRFAAERAADVTRQLLAFSRRQVLREATLDLNDVVGGLGDVARPTAASSCSTSRRSSGR